MRQREKEQVSNETMASHGGSRNGSHDGDDKKERYSDHGKLRMT